MNTKIICFAALLGLAATCQAQDKNLGIGAKPVDGAEVILDGSKEMLDAKWKYWEGPAFKSAMPIKWKVVADPVDAGGTVVMTDDRAADGGKYGAADIVTKAEYRDFRLHIEFNVAKPKGNSGVLGDFEDFRFPLLGARGDLNLTVKQQSVNTFDVKLTQVTS